MAVTTTTVQAPVSNVSKTSSMRLSSVTLSLAVLAVLAVLASAAPPAARAQQPSPSLAPYVPTPHDVVDRMLTLAQVTKADTVYDLGCGDGRIVITAAQKYGAHGVGVDIDPQRIAEATANAKQAGVDQLVQFKLQDARTVDLSPASVVTLYLLSASNLKLRPKLTHELKPGARIVSHQFTMGDWEPAKKDTFADANGMTRTLYLWVADGQPRP
jgi:SAM-dependent methyltransferase